MGSQGSLTPEPKPSPSSALESPDSQSWESHSPKTTGLAVHSAMSTTTQGFSERVHRLAANPHRLFTGWNFADPRESISSRISRPKCAPTAELFGHLPGYLQSTHPSPQGEDGDGDGDDYDKGTSTQDVLDPLRKRQRRSLRESAGVKPKPSQKRVVGVSDLKPQTPLPPAGMMRCLWGDDCTVQMAFNYTLETIGDWKNHVASHLAGSNKPMEDSAGSGQGAKSVVECRWDGCDAKVERGYLFKHIVTHEVRFKLLCPRGCGVAIRGDNLGRHLGSCASQN